MKVWLHEAAEALPNVAAKEPPTSVGDGAEGVCSPCSCTQRMPVHCRKPRLSGEQVVQLVEEVAAVQRLRARGEHATAAVDVEPRRTSSDNVRGTGGSAAEPHRLPEDIDPGTASGRPVPPLDERHRTLPAFALPQTLLDGAPQPLPAASAGAQRSTSTPAVDATTASSDGDRVRNLAIAGLASAAQPAPASQVGAGSALPSVARREAVRKLLEARCGDFAVSVRCCRLSRR